MLFSTEKISSPETIRRFKETEEKIARLAGRPREIAEAFMNRLRNRATLDFSLPEKTLDSLLLAGGETEWSAMFSDGSDESLALAAMIGEGNAALAGAMWSARPKYPAPYIGRWRPGSDFYGHWNRGHKIYLRQPPYRTADIKNFYFRPALNLVLAYTSALIGGFDLESHLAGGPEPDAPQSDGGLDDYLKAFWEDEGDFVGPLIAALLDRRDADSEKLLNELRARLPETDSPALTRQIISGLVKSERDEAHEAAEEILKAAVNEGIRYKLPRFEDDLAPAVIELMNRGTLKAFRRLLDIAASRNLARIPEVSKAFLTWTGLTEHSLMWADLDDDGFLSSTLSELGLGLDELGLGRHQWISEALAHAARCLADEQYRQAALSGGSPFKVFLAMWAAAVENLEQAESECLELLERKSRQLNLAAAALAVSIGHPARRFGLLAPLLNDPALTADRELVAWILSGLPNNLFELLPEPGRNRPILPQPEGCRTKPQRDARPWPWV